MTMTTNEAETESFQPALPRPCRARRPVRFFPEDFFDPGPSHSSVSLLQYPVPSPADNPLWPCPPAVFKSIIVSSTKNAGRASELDLLSSFSSAEKLSPPPFRRVISRRALINKNFKVIRPSEPAVILPRIYPSPSPRPAQGEDVSPLKATQRSLRNVLQRLMCPKRLQSVPLTYRETGPVHPNCRNLVVLRPLFRERTCDSTGSDMGKTAQFQSLEQLDAGKGRVAAVRKSHVLVLKRRNKQKSTFQRRGDDKENVEPGEELQKLTFGCQMRQNYVV